MKRGTGGWVTGDRFWDRHREISLLMDCLRDGANIQLTGQRRIGKTSLAREAAQRLQDEFVCVYADLQQCDSGQAAIAELAAATEPQPSVWSRVTKWAGQFGSKVSEFSVYQLKVTLKAGILEADWRVRGEELLDLLTSGNRPALVIFDELPILVNRLLKGDDYTITPERHKRTDEFLSWLRHVSQKYQGKLRLIVTGSIGLEPVVRQAGLSATLNHLRAFELGPWDRPTAAGCIEALAGEYDVALAAGVTDCMLDEIGVCIPHHVQVFFENVYEVYKLRSLQSVTVQVAKDVYKHKMLGARGHAELSHLEERLKLVLGIKLQEVAIDFLTEAAVVSGGLTPRAARFLAKDRLEPIEDSVVREILEILEHDGYVAARGARYVFVSKLQRDWWKSRFRFLYQPASKREGYPDAADAD